MAQVMRSAVLPAGPSASQQLHPQQQNTASTTSAQANFQMSPQPTDPPQPTQTGTNSVPIDQSLQTQAQNNGMPPHSGGPYARPTLQQMDAAMQYIRAAEEDFSDERRNFQTVQVPEYEKEVYMQHFDQLWRGVQEMEKRLVMYHALFGDEASTSKLVAIIVTTKEQRKLLDTPAAPPQYILGFHIVKALLAELASVMVRLSEAIAQTPPTAAASSPQA